MPQIYKAIKFAFYNIINRNGRLWLSPRHYWFSYFAQLRTLCRVKYLADSACRYCESWREHASSGMPWPLVTYSMMMEGVRFESNGSTLHYCKISIRLHSLTEMSRDRNGQTETAQTEKSCSWVRSCADADWKQKLSLRTPEVRNCSLCEPWWFYRDSASG